MMRRTREALEAALGALEEYVDPSRPFDPIISLAIDDLLEGLATLDKEESKCASGPFRI
jgi:hypothetical protein